MNIIKFSTYVTLILISLVWAGSFIVVRMTYKEISPINLGFLRFLLATPIMFIILILKRQKTRINIKDIIPLSILGLTGVTFLYIFQFIGISYTTASTSAVLINSNVIFIAILSSIFLKEFFTVKKIIGTLISFFGAILVIFAQISNENLMINVTFIFGCILIILSALSWAIYSIIGKILLYKYSPLTITTYAFALGTIYYLPFISTDIVNVVKEISVNGWIAIIYLGVICSVFGYLAWYHVLLKNEAIKSAVFLNFIPLFTILLALILGEVPTVVFIFGAILIIYGVYLTQKN
jgi:drug/metabolite transporter (DMT)-like permease